MKTSLVLSVVMSAVLTACGGGGESSAPAYPATPVGSSATDAVVVVPPTQNTEELGWSLEVPVASASVQPSRLRVVSTTIPACPGTLLAYVDMGMQTTAVSLKSQRETYMAVMLSVDGVGQEKQRSVATLRVADGAMSTQSTYEFRRTLSNTPAMALGVEVYKFTSLDYTAVDILEGTLQLTCEVSK